MAKNIVICCDGTGNEIEEHISNVLKLYRCLKRGREQRIYYDPGIGTLSSSDSWARFKHQAKGVVGLATGWGLDENIRNAYEFLIDTYSEGDRIFLFGFSRGAYTVRALAGMLRLIGLLNSDQRNLLGYALVAYKRASGDDDLSIGWRFQKVTRARYVPVHFVGVWDTVSSVFVPRPDRLYLPSWQVLPYTRTNPGIRAFRHAIAIDERRRMFRLNSWIPPESFEPRPFAQSDEPHTTKQLWFAGAHGDIGGGWPEPRSGLSKIPLEWMIEEAKADGLLVNTQMVNRLVLGKPRKGSEDDYAEPDLKAPVNDPMNPGWRVLEWLPKRVKWREWPKRLAFLWLYLPRSEPRRIPADAELHPSVEERREALPSYRPENLESYLRQRGEPSSSAPSDVHALK